MGSIVGSNADTSLPNRRTGNMFSTAIAIPDESSSSRTRSAKPSAYLRCQRNGGWITTVDASRSCAACTDRRSRSSGRGDHTRCVISRHGACTASTGTPNWRERRRMAAGSWLIGSAQTITSTPS